MYVREDQPHNRLVTLSFNVLWVNGFEKYGGRSLELIFWFLWWWIFYFRQWVFLLLDFDGGFLCFDGEFLWQWISDNGFLCQVSLFEEFLLGLELVGCSWFLQNPFFYYLIFSWFCMFFFCFFLGGERHKRGGEIYIFIHVF